MSDHITIQRDDLKRCPFCGTTAIEKAKLVDAFLRWTIMCGNPFCEAVCGTHEQADRGAAARIWQERNPNE